MQQKMFLLILLSTIMGAAFSIILPESMLVIRWIDTLFINLLRLVVLPLMFFSIASAVISLGTVKRLKSVWIYTSCYILFSLSQQPYRLASYYQIYFSPVLGCHLSIFF